MKNKLKIIFLASLWFAISGCSKSLLKIVSQNDDSPVTMFAETGERNFYTPIELNDSLLLLWENDVYGSFNNSSFIFFDSTIFVHDLGGRIHSFNIHTGKQTGVLKYKGAVYSTPLIFNYNIIIALVENNENRTELIFYDFVNGKELKSITIEGRIINQMLRIDDDLVVVTENGVIKRITFRGSEVWSININAFIHSNPAYSNGNIYFGTDAGEFVKIDFETSNVLFRKNLGAAFNSGVTIKNNSAFIADDDGIIYSISLHDGSINWQFETGAKIRMNPALDEKNVYAGNLAGKIISINRNNGTLNWYKEYKGMVFNSTPLITVNRIIISNLFKSVMLIDKMNGDIKKEIELEERVKMTPAIRNNILFLGLDQGTIRAYEIIN
ncbi:MAG: PQQ-binding-like beta-propeller repeat protein [Ignavibacteriaceae bacterium]